MSARKIKGSWWIDFSYNSQRIRKRSPDNTKAGAAEFEAFLRRHVAQHGSVHAAIASFDAKPPAPVPTLAKFAERWMRDYVAVNNKRSEQRAKHYHLRAHILPALGAQRLDMIRTVDIEQLKARCQARGLTAKTINNTLAVLRKCLNTAIDWELIESLPRIKFLRALVPPVRYFEPEEFSRLIAVTPEGFWRAFVVLHLQTGLRVGELIALEWSDVNLTTAMLTVCRSWVYGDLTGPKSFKIRYVPLSSDAVAVLKQTPREGQRVFAIPFRDPYRYLARRLRTFYDQAGLPRSGTHALRHTFATELTRLGAHQLVVKTLLGHSSLKMTERYAHVAPGTLRDSIALFESPKNRQGNPQATEPVFAGSESMNVGPREEYPCQD